MSLSSKNSLQEVPVADFVKEEERIVEFWKKIDAFKVSMKKSEGRKPFTFYDGPPFATGLPHYGHILAGTMKDVVTRYAHQTGHYVERRFGWDCHGLPIEMEIEKELKITCKQDVLNYGVANYNEKCREIVMRYASEWEIIVTRLGRWIDFKNDYKTMNPSYMESVWWGFKQLYDKELVYRGFKVMPYSTGCTTPLSNFEASLNYKNVTDPEIIAAFPLVGDENTSFLAWTTTPWTLPSNLALCVHPNFTYVKLHEEKSGKNYIMLKTRTQLLQEKNSQKVYKVIEEIQGEKLKGIHYVPLFPYFQEYGKKFDCFRVILGTFVTDDAGTGIVHCAPGFGEEDYKVCLENGIIQKGEDVPCPVDDSGCFTDIVSDWKGVYVKDADDSIMDYIKNKLGRLIKKGTIFHSYPFCWRSDKPLLYRAIPSWFVRVELLKDELLKNNNETYWVPDSIKTGRFYNWLTNCRDWCVSRNRYWGTPLPIWRSDDWEEIICIGSVAELEKLSGQKVTDLHKHFMDEIKIPSQKGKGVLKRIPEIFDCWFESGSMPFAQCHYPFENKDNFEPQRFPADFIAEGLDQTRGWFYTLLVLGTALFGKAPWKNLIVNGLVLAEDGKKMSKRLKNYPDPMDVVRRHGADALRLYLVSSPVVRAEDLWFEEDGVREVVRAIFLPWYNSYKFFVENALRFEKEHGSLLKQFSSVKASNVMSKWILSASQSLASFVNSEIKAYKLDSVISKMLKFIDQVSRWYIRLNRKRLKGLTTKEDWLEDLKVLFDVLLLSLKVMSPLTPFLTETMYQNLKWLLPEKDREESIHFLMIPDADQSLVFPEVERAVDRMQQVIEAGRALREKHKIELTMPVSEYIVFHIDQDFLSDIASLENYLKEELNTKSVMTSSDFVGQFRCMATLNHRVVAGRLGDKKDVVVQALAMLHTDDILKMLHVGELTVHGYKLLKSDLVVQFAFTGNAEKYVAYHEDVVVLMNHVIDETLEAEGVCKALGSEVQKLRKKGKLTVEDKVEVFLQFEDENEPLLKLLKANIDFLQQTFATLSMKVHFGNPCSDSSLEVLFFESPESRAQALELDRLKKEKEKNEREAKEKLRKERQEKEQQSNNNNNNKQHLNKHSANSKSEQTGKGGGGASVGSSSVVKEKKTKEKQPLPKEDRKKKTLDLVDSKFTVYLVKQRN